MILNVYSIRDRATASFGPPIFMATNGQAIRAFSDLVNAKGSKDLAHTHPEDFDLYHFGTWCDQTGSFDCTQPRQVAVGKDMVIPESVQRS